MCVCLSLNTHVLISPTEPWLIALGPGCSNSTKHSEEKHQYLTTNGLHSHFSGLIIRVMLYISLPVPHQDWDNLQLVVLTKRPV